MTIHESVQASFNAQCKQVDTERHKSRYKNISKNQARVDERLETNFYFWDVYEVTWYFTSNLTNISLKCTFYPHRGATLYDENITTFDATAKNLQVFS